LVVVASGLLLAAPLQAQSGTTAIVSGTVTSAAGQPLSGALLTLTSLDRGGTREETADASGLFRFALLAPGSYELRAERLGYRPVIARTLSLNGGARARVDLTLEQAPPPVLTVDTVAISTAAGSRFVAGGMRLGSAEINELPYRYEDVTSIAGLDSHLDGSLGADGLPGSMSLTVVDGIPVYDIPHPVARSEQLSGPTIARTSLSGVAIQSAPDVEWGGTAGSRVGLTTLTGTSGRGFSVEGAWSGKPLWSSNQLDISKPSLLSFQGAASATVPVTPGASQIVLSGEVLRQDTPLTPRISETVAGDLAGLDPDLIAALSDPSVETFTRYSALARFDALSPTSYFFLRGSAGYAVREFDGPGPIALGPGVALPEETIDYSFAGGYTRELNPDVGFELRAGVSGGTRTFDPAEMGMPAAYLPESGSSLGVLAQGAGKSSRTDLLVSPVLTYGTGGGTLRFGANARVSRHSMLESQPGSYLFSDAAALIAGQGYVSAVDAPEASFSTRELGAFLRYDAELTPDLRTSLGLRFDYEWLPQDATLDTQWLQASGLRNDEHPTGLAQLGGHAQLTWDADAATRISGALALHHGDVDSRAIAQLLSQDGDATETAFAGSGLTWPGGAIPSGPSTRPTLTLLGPDTRAPRSIDASIGITRDLFQGWSVHAGASMRRTDFLLRRRNLNLPAIAQAEDPNGRDVYGTLQKDGALVTATGGDALRFDSFGTVWALDPDGWSKYVSATGGIEYSSEPVDLFASYTWSETTDNWVGAASGVPDGELSPLLPDGDWAEGTSDFDVPHRITVGATARVSLATISAAYHFRSGLPFTPGYRAGVDANGDGSLLNDVAYIDAATVDPLLSDWPCLQDQVDGFATRNSCRGPSVHSVDVRLQLRLGRLGGREASLVIDGFDLIETEDGIVDDALLLVDPAGSIATSGSTVTIPFTLNSDFGSVLYPASRGRMIRVGFRIG
jgi:hypothetical protein